MPAAELPLLLSQIAALTQTSVQGAAAICLDDVAVNTKLLTGLKQGHKGHTILNVVKGSLLNKAVLIPGSLFVSGLTPWAVLPLLALGGLNLAHEGVEKLQGHDHAHDLELDRSSDPEALEKKKIREALKVDFILSAEISILTLSIVVGAPLLVQLGVLAATGVAMTAGLYGLIGGIIKLDDAGRFLSERKGDSRATKATRKLGRGIEKFVPHLMRGISIVGTVALFMIGGELMLHGIPGAEAAMTGLLSSFAANPLLHGPLSLASEIGVGLVAGLASLPVIAGIKKVSGRIRRRSAITHVTEKIPSFARAPSLPKISLRSGFGKALRRRDVENKPQAKIDPPKPL